MSAGVAPKDNISGLSSELEKHKGQMQKYRVPSQIVPPFRSISARMNVVKTEDGLRTAADADD